MCSQASKQASRKTAGQILGLPFRCSATNTHARLVVIHIKEPVPEWLRRRVTVLRLIGQQTWDEIEEILNVRITVIQILEALVRTKKKIYIYIYIYIYTKHARLDTKLCHHWPNKMQQAPHKRKQKIAKSSLAWAYRRCLIRPVPSCKDATQATRSWCQLEVTYLEWSTVISNVAMSTPTLIPV